MRNINTKKTAHIGMLVALEVVLSRFCSVITPIAKIGFAFLPISITGMLYGPWAAGIMAVATDIVGATLFPSGVFFPGFTLTAFLTGFTYGALLYEKPKTLPRIASCVVLVQLLLHLGLNTVWLQIITGKGYMLILPTRIMQACIMIPLMTTSIYLVAQKLRLFPNAVIKLRHKTK